MDLLADNNECGQALLFLTSKGNAILYDLFALKDAVPSIYGLNPSKAESSRYGILITLDFQYFTSSQKTEDIIQSDENLRDLDESLKKSYSKVLSRFFGYFDSILKYTMDIKAFLSDVGNGIYLQVSLESLMIDPDGKQLLCEILYLLGVILLLTDELIPGSSREKLLVAHKRYLGGHTESIDNVCKLLRSTGFIQELGKRPQHYPEFFFKRTDMPMSFINIVVSRLRLDDIYNQMSSFPEHRSIALASQGAMTAICLFFAPDILMGDSISMREIVDKFFFDNWVTTHYMGRVINLSQAWEPYPAAKTALSNTTQSNFIREIAKRRSESLKTLVSESGELLHDGVLTEEELMDRSVQILDTVRKCNYVLRWVMLHTAPPLFGSASKKSRQLRDDIMAELEDKKHLTFTLLLNTASLEFKLRGLHQALMARRVEKWNTCRDECESRMSELSKVYGGELKLSRVNKNSKLEKWFSDRKSEISNLNIEEPLKSGRLAMQIIRALKDSVELGQMESNLQVKEYVLDSIEYLTQIVRYAGVKEEFIITLQAISDFQYGWEILDGFTPLIQAEVKRDPSIVKRLRAIFIKISSVIETPILRFSQIDNSKQLNIISKYYSDEIVLFIQNVLQIIPKSIFELLSQVMTLQKTEGFLLPTKLEKDKIKAYARLDDRFEVARLTHGISTFAEGMMSMNSTLIGVVRVDAKSLLIEGMRKELVQRVCGFCSKLFSNQHKSKVPNIVLLERIKDLKEFMMRLSQSFEYVQDYIKVPGLRIWQEEISRIICFFVETESNVFLKHKIPPSESAYQSKAVPIVLEPIFGDVKSLTFVGALAEQLLTVIDPFQTIFVYGKQKWYSIKSKSEVCSLSIFASLYTGLGSYGMSGLDKLFGLKSVVCLQTFTSRLSKGNPCPKNWVYGLRQLENEVSMQSDESFRQVKSMISSKTTRTSLLPFTQSLLSLGSYMILRHQISYQLRLQCSFNSKALFYGIKNLNESLVEDEKRKIKMKGDPSDSAESQLLFEFGKYLTWSGQLDTLSTIYVLPEQISHVPEFLCLLVLGTSSRLSFIDRADQSPIIRKTVDHIDGNTFIFGLASVLNQFPTECSVKLFHLLGVYIASLLRSTGRTTEVKVIQIVLQLLLRGSQVDKEPFFKYAFYNL